MTVVSNTSPIINLAAIGQLELLRHLYGNIIIPQAVYEEIAIRGAGEPGATEVQSLEWIAKYTVNDRTLINLLSLELDPGEAEVIACALEIKADLLLLDERRARAIAERAGLQFTGILGSLVEAKSKGIITAVKPVVDALISEAGFWVADSLYKRTLEVAGEQDSIL